MPRSWPRRLATGTQWLLAVMLASSMTLIGDPGSARKRASPFLVQELSNTAQLQIPDGTQIGSSIVVSGFETDVADVDVTLRNLNHPHVDTLDLLLLGPGGQTAIILSDTGISANQVTLTLDDQAAMQIPSASALSTGVFQPTNFGGGDTFVLPAPPSPPSGALLGVFNSTDPNGVWTLFARHDTPGFSGSLNGGWSLRITSENGVPTASPDTFTARAGKTLNVPGGVLENDADPDGDPLTASLAGTPRKGKVRLQPDGSFTYKATKKAKGNDTFTYLAVDPGGLSDLETVTIKIKKAKKTRRR